METAFISNYEPRIRSTPLNGKKVLVRGSEAGYVKVLEGRQFTFIKTVQDQRPVRKPVSYLNT